MATRFTLFLIACALLSVAGFGQVDGPATLPRTTPSVVAVSTNVAKTVLATDNLQAAINAAVCGDVLNVDPATIYTGGLKLPSLPCDAQHWITIQSANPIVYDFLGRVDKHQQLPRIILPQSNSFISGGVFVTLKGFEVTTLSNRPLVYSLIVPWGGHDIIYDSLYVHGTATDETQRGLLTSNATNIAVINSRFEDFHCLAAVGSCSDAQAIAGGLSSQDEGNFYIHNNDLQASGENILFGGGAATVVPHDITITGNSISKSGCWNPGDPCFAPVKNEPWITKNLLEFKNAAYVLVEGNKFSGSWGGFSQLGWAVLITPKNQNNLCPICADHDITIRNNDFSKTGQAFQMGFGPSDALGWPAGAFNYSIHDNHFSDLNYSTCYQCGHWLMQISAGSNNGQTLHDVSIINNTFSLEGKFHPPNPSDGKYHGFLMLTSPPVGTQQPYNITFQGNVVPSGNSPIYSTGGGSTNCVNNYLTNFAQLFQNCWVTSAFTNNVILNPDYTQNMTWPAGNYVLPLGANPAGLP
jgi:hypothetical protein